MKNVTEKTGGFFERYASQFDGIYDTQNNTGLTGWINQYLRTSMAIRYQKTFETLHPMQGYSVLDIGCGSGRYIVTCLALGASNVIGIDLSEKMISIAKAAVKQLDTVNPNVQFICEDFMSYSFSEQYDYAIVMGVMDYIENPKDFLTKLSKTVSVKAVLSFPIAESIWTLQRKVRYKLRGCPLYFYRRGQLEELMKYSGFKSYSIERIARDYFVVAEG